MLTLQEYFIPKVMTKGVLDWGDITGYGHTVKLFKIVHIRTTQKESLTQGPGSVPYSRLCGLEPDSVRLEIPWKDGDVVTLLTNLTAFRAADCNIAANIFVVGSVLVISGGDIVPEMPDGSKWLVDTFEVRRSVGRRDLLIGTLGLLRWWKV